MTKVNVLANDWISSDRLLNTMFVLEAGQGVEPSTKSGGKINPDTGIYSAKFETALPIADLMAHFELTKDAVLSVNGGEVVLFQKTSEGPVGRLLWGRDVLRELNVF